MLGLALEVPDTVQDVKALSSILETIGFEVEPRNGLNAQVTFQNISWVILEFEEQLIKTTVLTRPNPRQRCNTCPHEAKIVLESSIF